MSHSALCLLSHPGSTRLRLFCPRAHILITSPSYPYLVTINSVLPAIVAGNAVLLKPSPQTPLTAERVALALTRAGVPENIIQVLHLSPELTIHAVQHELVNFVSFTGSVTGGRKIQEAALTAKYFKGVALEVILCYWAVLVILMKNIYSSEERIRHMSEPMQIWIIQWRRSSMVSFIFKDLAQLMMRTITKVLSTTLARAVVQLKYLTNLSRDVKDIR